MNNLDKELRAKAKPIKRTPSKKLKLFSLTDRYKGLVKRLSIHIQDVPVYKSPEDRGTLVGNNCTVFGTLQVYNKEKTQVSNINFTMPLSTTGYFEDNILEMIDQAIELKQESVKKETK